MSDELVVDWALFSSEKNEGSIKEVISSQINAGRISNQGPHGNFSDYELSSFSPCSKLL